MTDFEECGDWVFDFMKGQQDCAKGVPHKEGSEAYNRGYAAEYEFQQIRDSLSCK